VDPRFHIPKKRGTDITSHFEGIAEKGVLTHGTEPERNCLMLFF